MSENETTGTTPGTNGTKTEAERLQWCSCDPKRPVGVPHEPNCPVESFQLTEDGAAFIREMAATHLSSKDDGMRLQLVHAWSLKAKAIAERLGKVEQAGARLKAEREASRSAPEAQGE
ncbi:MAG: hypothetical protein KGJ23_08680 [Euryarchaeota archaeon]|nr:hypothetical protein [Euryarchaeota archaeon]MDE1836678.1 hypothetical protein [Euryarchaeota archaeon]MDE1880293.1 hypothetical protein [Euryarchaeota archaeon]MDE2044648.1 hypothetical protein [Thermoplasmata archaeon]